MNKGHALVLFISITLLTGCITHYQYKAFGNVVDADGKSNRAVIYWEKDEGRLWYGGRYENTDSTVNMRVCKKIPQHFDQGEHDYVELKSKAGDLRLAMVGIKGEFVELPEQKHQKLRDGEYCGAIVLNQRLVRTEHLIKGGRPEIIILCRNEARTERYPEIGKYTFGPISREETGKERTGPEACFCEGVQ